MKLKIITTAFLAATFLFQYMPVSYPSTALAPKAVSETHETEPLDADTVRFTVVDYDTGEKIELDKEFGYFAIVPYIWSGDDKQQAPSTNYLYPDSNPYIWKQTISEDETMSINLADGSLNDNYFLPEDYEEINRYDNGSVDVVIKLKSNEGFELPPGYVRVTVTDGDTGELVPDEVLAEEPLTIGTNIVNEGGVTGPVIRVEKNRAVIKENLASLYKSADKFELYFDGKSEMKLYDNNSMDLFLTTAPKTETDGDVNKDGSFGISDFITVQQWMLGSKDVSMKSWRAADYNKDNRLNTFDLCIMKTELVASMSAPQKSYDFNAEYVRTDNYLAGAEYPYTVLITSREELDEYMEEDVKYDPMLAYPPVPWSQVYGFTDAIAKYDEEWFDSHKLLMVIAQEGSGSISHKVLNVAEDHVDIQKILPEMGTCDMAQWHILIELDKSAEICSEADYKVNFTE